MCLHVPGGEGPGVSTGDGVNAQFVFRSAEKTRSLQQLEARPSQSWSSSPTSACRRNRRWIPSPRELYIHDDAARRRAEKYELRARCINFPLEDRDDFSLVVLYEFLLSRFDSRRSLLGLFIRCRLRQPSLYFILFHSYLIYMYI